MQKKIILKTTILFAAALGLICLFTLILAKPGNNYYYTQIDNTRIEQIDPQGGVINFQGSLPYSYTLPALDEKGKKKDITFSASKELTEGAYIRLTVKPIRGVTAWEEVQYEELPAAVRSNYDAPAF